jgi:hypothetical protein
MNGYVQTRCPRCGNAAWGHPMQAVPCNSCGQQVPPMAQPQGWGAAPGMGSFGAAPGMQPQQPQGTPAPQQAWGAPPAAGGQPPGMGGFGQPAAGFAQQPQAAAAQPGAGPKMNVNLPYGIKLPINIGGKHMRLKIIGGVILTIALAVGAVIFKKTKTPKGMISYSSVGLSGKPDADAAYMNLVKDATKWKKDAILWSVNFQAVRADGTIDVGKGAEVVYVSPNASASHAQSVRSDSVRKYGLTASGVKPSQYGWNDVYEGIEAHPEPQCKIKDVVALLQKQGLTGDKTVRITFDPKFADFYAWRVIGSDPKIDALFGWSDCQPIK